eukprot:Seg36.8 transcript_id=Seg36.8/GoldUCD/mRNA.D3Y31 product="putative signal peptidase complex subunit 2" protein_id=Seg36.8/GoldUCD/D3Y31
MAAAGKAQKDKSGFLHKFLDQEKPIEVDKWDGNAVKNALDDVVRKDPDNTWKIATSLRRYDHMYHIMVQYEDGKTKKSKEVEMLKSVSEWFDENGLLLSHKFETEIKNIQSGLCGEKKDQ